MKEHGLTELKNHTHTHTNSNNRKNTWYKAKHIIVNKRIWIKF